MSQQTRIDVVVDYYTRWMSTFPDIPTLAAAPLDRVNQLWAGLGYYRRARFLHVGAQQVMRQFAGVLPHDVASLRSIQGIGPYTAGAIASIAFGVRAPCVDGNVERVLSRICPDANFYSSSSSSSSRSGSSSGSAVSATWWALAGQLVGENKKEKEEDEQGKKGKKKKVLKMESFRSSVDDDDDASHVMSKTLDVHTSNDSGVQSTSNDELFWPGDLNQALMELGATVCKPRAAAECHKCPLLAEGVCGAARQAAEAGLTPDQYGPFMARYPARLAKRDGAKKQGKQQTVKRKKTGGNVEEDDDDDDGGDYRVGGGGRGATGRVRFSSKGVKVRDEKVAVIVAWTRDVCDNVHGDVDNNNEDDIDNDSDRTRVLIMQRPADGLLGGLWESANVVLDNSSSTTSDATTSSAAAAGADADADPDARAQVANRSSALWAKVLSSCGHGARVAYDEVVYAGKVMHIFSHIRQQLFVYAARVDGAVCSVPLRGTTGDGRAFRWVYAKQVNEAAIATQMKKVVGRGLRHVGVNAVQCTEDKKTRKKRRETVS